MNKNTKHYLALISVFNEIDDDEDDHLIDCLSTAMDIIWYRLTKEDRDYVESIVGKEIDDEEE